MVMVLYSSRMKFSHFSIWPLFYVSTDIYIYIYIYICICIYIYMYMYIYVERTELSYALEMWLKLKHKKNPDMPTLTMLAIKEKT